jgi:predicted DNA-binding transcriptional regulator AlpA
MKTNGLDTRPQPATQLLNEVEAGQFLSLSHRTLQNWRVKGGGPKYLKIGAKSVRYRLSDLQSWLENATRSNTSQAMPQ